MNLHSANEGVRRGEKLKARMQASGLTMQGRELWTDDEIAILRSNYPDYPTMRRLLPGRSAKGIWRKIDKLNIGRKLNVWTAADVSKLRRLFGRASRAELEQSLPDRTWRNIVKTAYRHGLRRPRRRYVVVPSEQMNVIRARCEELGYTMIDLDELAGTRDYFKNGASFFLRPDMRKVDKAVRALDGKLVVVWND
ncbi:hypothetical protein [Rhizobium sp. PP-CC-3G-465]|uniref:hypothetical protein n=1 Tax=Rhizobium sp. PP-CC-3G-465 TaxID=2135648 RepID=UPI0010521311|nr:hypothetical protein C8J33_101918 [Rhizobium sp. PP-CC-3G-465]